MFKIEGEETSENDIKFNLENSRDGGINLICIVPNVKKFYIGRILQSGELKIFSRNTNATRLNLDDAGRIKIILQNPLGDSPTTTGV